MKPPEPFTWFVDRSLGRKIVADLRAAGFQKSTARISQTTRPTRSGLRKRAVGRGWVVLTKDKAVRRNALESAAILAGDVACFSLGHGNLKAEQMAQAFIAARSRMEKVLRRYDPPLTAAVTSTGHVSLLMKDGVLLSKPRSIK